MNTERRFQNIALIGFMGTGKSSVGRIVAHQLHFQFIDTDDLIEARSGKTISQIFVGDGETVFRDWEARILDELSAQKQMVLATGGGLGANPAHLAGLKSHSVVICLWASPETIWERVKIQEHRPLLQTPEPLEKIRALLAQREACYKQADALINTERRSARDVAQQVLHQFHLARSTP